MSDEVRVAKWGATGGGASFYPLRRGLVGPCALPFLLPFSATRWDVLSGVCISIVFLFHYILQLYYSTKER